MSQTTEFKNANISVNLSKKSGSKVHLDVTISPEATLYAFKKAIKNVSKEVSVPGFRKGKAPDNYILENYKSAVDNEWRSIVSEAAWTDALELTQVFPLSRNSKVKTNIESISKEAPSKLSFEFETNPSIPDLDFSDLKIEKEEAKPVTADQKEMVLNQIKMSNAKWQEVKDESAKEGDFLDLDIYNLDSNFDICKDTRFCLKEGQTGKWLIKLLEGKKVGDVVEGTSENEHDHSAETCDDPTHDHSHEFKPTHCKVTIKGHLRAELPELDDELAKKAGAPNVEELLVRIEKSLSLNAEKAVKEKQLEQLLEKLLEKYQFDIPTSIIQDQVEHRLSFAIENLKKQNLNETELKTKIQELENKISKELEEGFRLFFIERKVAMQEKLEISQEEIMQEFMKQITNQEGGIIHQNMQPEEIRERLTSYLLSEKARDWMLTQAIQ